VSLVPADRLLASPPLGERMAALLRQAIVNGDLKPGSELRQAAIAERYGVSRIPVREAIQMLERDGLVVIQRNRRVVVASLSDSDLADHYSVRALIEGEAAFRASRFPEAVAEIEKAHALGQDVLESRDIGAFTAANEAFHAAVWTASGSTRLHLIAKQLWTGIAPHTPSFLPNQIDRSFEEHRRILKAIRSGNPDDAQVAMSNHILRSAADLKEFRTKRASTKDHAGG
jgi:DNA-binding GntR family transcriptional regulator